jgi:hypothetical protein
MRLQHELVMERVRISAFPEATSRLRGMYFFADEASALRILESWSDLPEHFKEECLAEVGFLDGLRRSQHDSMWIEEYMWIDRPFQEEDIVWIRKYWSGEAMNEFPLWEVVAEGSLWVFGTEVRSRAHDSIAKEQPESLGMLELSRVAADLDSNLGHCAPLVANVGSHWLVEYFMDMRDATNVRFLDSLRNYRGPKNTSELNAAILDRDGLRVPNFMEQAFEFQPPPDLASLLLPQANAVTSKDVENRATRRKS